jgi:hypothetical protein
VFFSLIKSYLENRYQKTKFNNKLSTWKKIKKGVPHGSILGPLLFLIYINDLPSFLQYFGPTNTSIVLFADDTSVIINELNFKNLEEKLSLLLKLKNELFHLNILLALNYDKTCCMKFSAKQDYAYTLKIQYNNKNIHEANNVEFLGMILKKSY